MTQKIITDSDHVSGVSIIEPLVIQQWSKTPPTEPGWYWYYGKGFGVGDPIILHIFRNGPSMIAVEPGNKSHYLFGSSWRLDAYWLGPITPPEPPEEK